MIASLLRTAAAATLLALGATPALAHAHLKSEVPPADGTAAAPDALTLQFTEGVELRFTGLVLKGPDGAAVATGPATLAAGDPSRLIVPVTVRLAPGPYEVAWHALATDGHKTSGRYRFTVAP